MLRLVLVGLVAGCAGPEVPAGPALPFDRTGASEVFALDALPARLVLPASNLPAQAASPERFALDPVEADTSYADGPRTGFTFDLPFLTLRTQERFAPEGMVVEVDGAPLGYDVAPRAPGHTGWRVKNGQLHVVVDGSRQTLSATVVHPGVTARLAHVERSLSEQSDEDFVRFSHSIGQVTRTGLLLPAPASAQWDLRVPAGGKLTTSLALVPPPTESGESDGAEVVVSIIAGGVRTEVGRRAVPTPTYAHRGTTFWTSWIGADLGFDDWEIDLAPFGGQEVTVLMETETAGSADYDYVFVGAPVLSGSPTGKVRRVVVIGLDTTRPDHFGLYGYSRDTTPELDAHAADAAVFDAAWTPAPRTRPSFRSATTGRNVLDAVGATNIGEVFRAHGFATAGIVANVHLNPRFDFHQGFEHWQLDPSARAVHQVDRALAWLDDHAERDTYLFLHMMDPHLFYSAPDEYTERFVDDPDPSLPPVFNRWDTLYWEQDGVLTDRRKRHIAGMYDGEIAYMSAELQRLFDGLEALGGNTLVVVHTDHGEEFWEHNGFEHNHTLYDELVKAGLWVRPPGGLEQGLRLDEPVTLADIAPTLYDYVGFTDVPITDGRSLKPLIDGTDRGRWERPLPIGHLMYDRERWGVVVYGHKYILHTGTGREELYDLQADPAEKVNLAATTDLEPFREALSEAHQMPVGPGWRVHLRARGQVPIIWELPQPCEDAGVIDPEAMRQIRANLVWGETPKALPEDVAVIEISEDRTVLTIHPGPVSDGTLWVRFAEPVEPGGTLSRHDKPLRWYEESDGPYTARNALAVVRVRPGTVLDPPAGEAERMGLTTEGAQADLELLEALGYIGGGGGH